MKATALRFYEQAGLLSARRSDSGYRLYDDESVERLRFISSGKHLGLPLQEIRDLLRVWDDGLCTDVRERLRPMLLARIAEADERAAELAGFTGRLRAALADLDGPPRPGRCDPGCGFLRRRAQAPVSVELSPRRSAPEPVPIACALTGDDRAERIEQWRRLLAGAPVDAIAGGLRFELATDLAGRVAELAEAEQRCCAFFEFALRLRGARLQFEVRAPAHAAPLLAEVFGTADRCHERGC
jgi:MerR family copper efflux transcriptional regulator